LSIAPTKYFETQCVYAGGDGELREVGLGNYKRDSSKKSDSGSQ